LISKGSELLLALSIPLSWFLAAALFYILAKYGVIAFFLAYILLVVAVGAIINKAAKNRLDRGIYRRP